MQRRSPFIMNKVLILVIDGCAPEFNFFRFLYAVFGIHARRT